MPNFHKKRPFSQEWLIFKKGLFLQSLTLSWPNYRPERPKGEKDEVKRPKGLQLEVGARRAPRLLVCNIFGHGHGMTIDQGLSHQASGSGFRMAHCLQILK